MGWHDTLQAAWQRHERNARILVLVLRVINKLAREDPVFRAVVQDVLAVPYCRRSICEDSSYADAPWCLALQHIANGIFVVHVLFEFDSAIVQRLGEVADATQEGAHHIPQLLLDGQQITLPVAGPDLHADMAGSAAHAVLRSASPRSNATQKTRNLVGDDVEGAQNDALPVPAAIRKAGAGALPHNIVNHRFALPTQSMLPCQVSTARASAYRHAGTRAASPFTHQPRPAKRTAGHVTHTLQHCPARGRTWLGRRITTRSHPRMRALHLVSVA